MDEVLETQKPTLVTKAGMPTRGYRLEKRLLDIALSSAALVCLMPMMLLIGILIVMDSPGPIVHRQGRVGYQGKLFRMYKFRSMREDAEEMLPDLLKDNEAAGPLFKIRRDPRMTRVGKIIRRLSLDELPQFFNVVGGSMSLVGPRPPLPNEVEQYEEWQRRRLETVPGLTGLWQVSGRSNTSFYDMVRLDLQYIDNWSLALDLKILLKTVPCVLRGHGAY